MVLLFWIVVVMILGPGACRFIDGIAMVVYNANDDYKRKMADHKAYQEWMEKETDRIYYGKSNDDI